MHKEAAERLRGKTEGFEEAERLEEEEAKAGAEAASKDKESSEVADTQSADVKEKPKDRILTGKYI